MEVLPDRDRGRVVILPDSTTGLLLVVALAAIALLVLAVAVLALRLRKLHRRYAVALGPDRNEDAFEVMARLTDEIAQVRADIGVVHGNSETLRELLRTTTSRVGIVRYDAFEDMGGALSFSAALLDESADGIVLSAINGRTETRTYAKPIANGRSTYNLSPEEEAAITAAIKGDKGIAAPVPGRSRRRRAVS